jgi:hypothetical protein
VGVAYKLGRPVDEIMTMHPRDLASLIDHHEEAVYAAGEPERRQKRLEVHGLG